MTSTLTAPEFVTPLYACDGVTVINICDWLDEVCPVVDTAANWHAVCALVQDYCATYRVSYYAQSRENFFLFEAEDLARAEGNKFVIVEDLS